ncbi:Zn-ribbon domain-containing OB-fold protein [Georgenia sp. SYP-B2076]|uniref:Zn-ribbon domain-containing OB-fold protein n=1 Tax=Georgenia sp. SYP-B2076 TaxID=2495881 RepID=UPI002100F1B7|nr:OB-fold domain-containing protein [Georgenia sp. SYP-B2076]
MSTDVIATERFPEPRPATAVDAGGQVRLAGWRCTRCVHPLALRAPWCPLCRGDLREHDFGPHGTVWSSTVVRVPLPGREPPYALAYVDLDDGPRVLGHLSSPHRLPVGAAVTLRGSSALGDLLFDGTDA